MRAVTILMIAALLLTGCGTAAVGSAVENAVTAASAESVFRPVGDTVTREEAEKIALDHAGFTAEQVTDLRTEYETDDGVARYEVQFRQGRWEYDYEINANTGAILSYDRDD